MLRPGLHFHNGCAITPADLDIIRRWSPLSLLLAMDGVVESQPDLLKDAWEIAQRPPLVLRRYWTPRKGGPVVWGTHAHETCILAHTCIRAGIPAEYLMLKPFNEPNMPAWAQWEGFGDREEDMIAYNEALLLFIEIARRECPGVRIGGPHLTVGNRDVKFPNDPVGVYYYHGESGRFEASRCSDALSALDVHFVHTYGMHPGQYADRAHGLRFLEYEKYLQGKDIYIVEGAYGINSGQAADQNTVRGQETVAYLRLLGDNYPQVKGIALWIGGDPGAGWFSFCHSNGPNPESHRPVVYAVEAACHDQDPEPGPAPEPEPLPGPDTDEWDWDDLTEHMISTVRWTEAPRPQDTQWRVTRIEVQGETDNFSLFAVLPTGSGAQVRFSWLDGEYIASPKADPMAPRGAREWAASMPMFAPWGAYSVEIVGNSQRVDGLGLYGSNLDHRYKGHHPVLVFFERVQGQPEPVPEPQPQPAPVPPTPPPPTPADDPYSLMKGCARAGIKVVDLRDEIESFSNMQALSALWRPFRLIRLLVVHHSGSDDLYQTPLSIARYRVLEKGDPTIPYHFCIPRTGQLFFTARLCYMLPNSGNPAANAESISICLPGDYRAGKWVPSVAQLRTLRTLIYVVLPQFLGGGWGQYRGLWVAPHGLIVPTECPGDNIVDGFVWADGWQTLSNTESRLVTDTMATYEAQALTTRIEDDHGLQTDVQENL